MPAKPRIIGTGTLVALVAAAAIMAWNYYDTSNRESAIQHEKLNMFSGKFTIPAGPGIDKIIENSSSLSLSKDQEQKLRALDKEWNTASAAAAQKLRDESANAQERMNATAADKTSVDELKQIAEPLSQATAEYRRIADEYRNRALAELNDEQRNKLTPSISERNDKK